MKIPKAPGYTSVFLFGAAWNSLVERSLGASLFCLGAAFIFYVCKKLKVDQNLVVVLVLVSAAYALLLGSLVFKGN